MIIAFPRQLLRFVLSNVFNHDRAFPAYRNKEYPKRETGMILYTLPLRVPQLERDFTTRPLRVINIDACREKEISIPPPSLSLSLSLFFPI